MSRPLKDLAEAFYNLAAVIRNGGAMVRVDSFARACSLVTPIIRSRLFRPLLHSIREGVNDIVQASRRIATLPELVDADIRRNTTETLI